MKRKTETVATIMLALTAFFWVDIGAALSLYIGCMHYPDHPHPELGFTHSLWMHNHYVFITAAESTGLALMVYCVGAVILASLFVDPDRGRSALFSYSMYARYIVQTQPLKIFTLAGMASLITIIFIGPFIVNQMISHNMVLNLSRECITMKHTSMEKIPDGCPR